MPITGRILAGADFPPVGPPANAYTTTIALSTNADAGEWLMFVQVGGYGWANGTCIPPQDDPGVGNVTFDSIEHTSFAYSPGPPQFNEAVEQIGYISNPSAACPDHITTAYFGSDYPNLAYSSPGLLSAGIAAGDTISINWPAGGKRWDGYLGFVAGIYAPFDVDGSNLPIHLDGSTPDTGGSGNNVATDSTTSPDATTNASTSAATGKGSAAIVAVSWNDPSQLPTLTDGWTLLAHYTDASSPGWAGLLAGRVFDAGDTSTYTFNATFSSPVLSETAIDTWQLTTDGLHLNHTF